MSLARAYRRRLILSHVISQAGDRLYLLALPILVYSLYKSPAVLGFTLLIQSAPALLFANLTNNILTRVKPHILLPVCDAIAGVTLFALAFLYASHSYAVVIFVIIISFMMYIIAATKKFIVPDIVSKDDTGKMNSIMLLITAILKLIVLLGSATMIDRIGMKVVIIVNGLSFFVSAGLLALGKPPCIEHQFKINSSDVSPIKPMVICLYQSALSAFHVFIMVFLKEIIGVDYQRMGYFLCAEASGACIASLLMLLWKQNIGLVYIWSLLSGVAIVLSAVTRAPIFIAISLFVLGAAVMAFGITVLTSIQLCESRIRMIAGFERWVAIGSIVAPVAGYLVIFYKNPNSLIQICGVLIIFGSIALILIQERRRYETIVNFVGGHLVSRL